MDIIKIYFKFFKLFLMAIEKKNIYFLHNISSIIYLHVIIICLFNKIFHVM